MNKKITGRLLLLCVAIFTTAIALFVSQYVAPEYKLVITLGVTPLLYAAFIFALRQAKVIRIIGVDDR
ncbi:hypothetical protein VTH8203_01485 [Vibrio thalassae]|uniref:Uncharacterized protein n=1 Tax=Vibrio thalassae TaxID=1243014 RepID=A0A240EIV6_9VIBR|nr:hypothetical protein [Vibrio thalassae]SNX47870.1 hypothetical protein VTH8203_01485 [Vibrio thalassae]